MPIIIRLLLKKHTYNCVKTIKKKNTTINFGQKTKWKTQTKRAVPLAIKQSEADLIKNSATIIAEMHTTTNLNPPQTILLETLITNF